MDIPILKDIVIVFSLAIPIIYVCDKIHIPSIIALFVTGILAGPEVIGLIHSHGEVEHLAEIGVILLLFTIGIEFSLKELWKMKTLVLVGGALQMVLTAVGGIALMTALNYPLTSAIFFGCVIAPSSTAIVLKLLQERGEIAQPHGKSALGILIFQDIAVVPLMLLMPMLSGNNENFVSSILILSGKALIIVVLTIVLAIWVIPKVLYRIAKTRNQELFLLSIFTIGLGIAILTLKMGLSLGLGAFLAGLIISESRYSYQALAGILPFRQVFMPFFFLSIGMLLHIPFLINNLPLILVMAAGVLLWKVVVVTAVGLLLKISLRSSILTGLVISQVGEFSFVLVASGMNAGLSLGQIYQPFLAVCVLTMTLTPLFIAMGPKWVEHIARFPLIRRWAQESHAIESLETTGKKDHVIIVGFGVNGRNIAHAAKIGNIPYVILELNPVTVQEEYAKGECIYYGDASHAPILEHADIHKARVLVSVIADSMATRTIVSVAHSLNPNLHIIARTRFVTEVEPLYQKGASEVIPEEFETSVEIFTRVMKKYLIAEDKIHGFINHIRSNGYQTLRKPERIETDWKDLKLNFPNIEISTFHIVEESEIHSKTLANLHLNKNHGVVVLAIRRNQQTITDIYGDTEILPNDDVIVLGRTEKLARFAELIKPTNNNSPKS